MFGKHVYASASAGNEEAFHPRPVRIKECNDVVQDVIGNGLHEGVVVAVGKHIELEAFGLHAELGRNVFKDNGSEIRQREVNSGKLMLTT